jgi:hypothetical protein
MREATGGTLLLQLVITILAVFVFFIASVMQFSRVYRIKGTIVDAIERAEGGITDNKELEAVMKKAGYSGPYELCKFDKESRGVYYTLTIYARFTLLPRFASLSVPVKGETRTIDTGIFYDGNQDALFTGGYSKDGGTCIKR